LQDRAYNALLKQRGWLLRPTTLSRMVYMLWCCIKIRGRE
jgi:hypothetical protein